MKYSILLSIALSGWIILIYFQRDFFLSQFPNLSVSSMWRIFQQNPQTGVQIQPSRIQSEIKRDLYNSLSPGMSYDEVRNLIGWDGILIYEHEVDYSDTKIHEKIYQWSHQDIYAGEHDLSNAGEINPYWSVTLQFQNDILINKSSLNLAP